MKRLNIHNPITWVLNLRGMQLLSYSLFLLSLCIVVFAFLALQKVDVITNWKIIVPKESFKTGETVVLKSEYTKVRDVQGKSVRYIECQNRNKIWVRYPLNEAVANRGSGSGGTGIVVKIPETIADLPTTCKFTIVIDYEVFSWKHVLEVNSSNTFKLEQGDASPSSLSSENVSTNDSTSQTPANLAQGPASAQGRPTSSGVSSSSSNNNSSRQVSQSNNSQFSGAEGTPPQPTPQPEPNPQPTNLLPGVERCVLGLNLLGGCL